MFNPHRLSRSLETQNSGGYYGGFSWHWILPKEEVFQVTGRGARPVEGYVAGQLVRRVGIVGLSLSDKSLAGFNLQFSPHSCRKEYLGGWT